MSRPTDPPVRDAVLDRIEAALPDGWTLATSDTRLTLRRTEPVWSLYGNRINAPMDTESPTEHASRIKRFGKQIHPELVYRMEPRWTADRIAEIERANAATRAAVADLPKKHGIEHLRSKFSKRRVSYVGTTKAEKLQVSVFEAERSKLEATIQTLPDCHTERFSLFVESESGLEDSFHLIHPEGASQETFGLAQKIKEICGSK